MEITVPDGMLMNEALIEQLTTQMLDLISPKADKSALEVALADISQLEGTVGEALRVPEEVITAELVLKGNNVVGYTIEWPSSVISEKRKLKMCNLHYGEDRQHRFILHAPSGGSYLVLDIYNETILVVAGGGDIGEYTSEWTSSNPTYQLTIPILIMRLE